MITITQRLAFQLRSVMRRTFGPFRGNGPAVGFIADKEGLIVRSMSTDAAVEFRDPGERPAETLWLPFEVLADVEGKKDHPVDLEATGNGQVSAQWRSGSVPQCVAYDVKEPFEADKVLDLPTEFTANPPELLHALHEASEVTESGNVRFATNCVQLCPDGTVCATDGHQLLIQSGFTFPWQEPVLVLRNKVFNSPELPQGEPVSVARNDDWAVISVGPWTFYLRINKDGRYPNVSRYVRDPIAAKARCQFSEDDRRFLIETLPQLPCHDEDNFPVTLDLNGRVAVRAKTADRATPTEVVLTNSQWSGEPIRVNMNRAYLMQAMKLGLEDLCFFGDEDALLCQTADRKFVWMPLDAESAIPPADDAIRIESPRGKPVVPISQPVKPRRVPPMSEPTTNTNGKANGNGHATTNGHARTNGEVKANGEAHKPSRRKANRQRTGRAD